MATGRVIDAVAATARRAALQGAQLSHEPRRVEQLGAAAVQDREQIAIDEAEVRCVVARASDRISPRYSPEPSSCTFRLTAIAQEEQQPGLLLLGDVFVFLLVQ